MSETVVIIGAGHAGVQAAASLREDGFAGAVMLLDAQTHKPYQRPPLSKAFMKGEAAAESLVLRGDDFYPQKDIGLRLGARVVAIDRASRAVMLAGGERVAYDHLILATGARPRPFAAPGVELDGVMTLRTLDDASALKARLATASQVAVVGAGFIGLEFAAVAAAFGHRAVVVDIADRVMGRAVSPVMSEAFAAKHRALGSSLLMGASVAEFAGEDGRLTGLRLRDGRFFASDLALVGVGVLPEDALAREAGLAVENGVVVDDHLRASDPAISAIGDSAFFPNPFGAGRIRLESVQNAVDQARCVARRIAGRPEPYRATPWFWSDQADYKLQTAGLPIGVEDYVTRGDVASGRFSSFGLKDGRVVVVESINRPADHMAARRFLAGAPLTREQAMDEAYDLKAHAIRSPRP
ncbi:MAG: pyridine nucleotide-disulfide oxidoreductase [Rhizobiales bacterium 65-9]|nr:FAD-dependent oxidoreductase [Hyphomicrobiales bacterium]OJY37981.1 MAG: pyridine nucleotide-disulfide oxidoreductase [Rhizobiales bacterium 65-9]